MTFQVIVELGTGYFAEKSVSTASELIDRKVYLDHINVFCVKLIYFVIINDKFAKYNIHSESISRQID